MTTTTQTAPTQAQWDAANKFLGELFINSTLAQGYLDICQQANGQTNAPEILNNWLSSQGYDTTPELVYAALIALQNTSLGYWSGLYGQSFFQDTKGHTSVAPVLAIIPNAEGNAIPYLDGVALKNFTFKSVITNNIPNPTLAWGLDSNSTAGNIIFYYTSPVNANPEPPTGYTGNWFQGTLQTANNTSPQSYFGGLTNPNNLQENAVSLGDAAQQSVDFIAEYKYWFIGGGVTLAVLGILVFRFKLGRWPFQRVQEQIQEQKEVVEQIEQNEPQQENRQDPSNDQGNNISPEKALEEIHMKQMFKDMPFFTPENFRSLNAFERKQIIEGYVADFDSKYQIVDGVPVLRENPPDVLIPQPQKIEQPEPKPNQVSSKDLSQHQPQQQPLQQQKVQSTQNNSPQFTDNEKTAVRSQQVPSTDNQKLDKDSKEKGQFEEGEK